MSTINKSGKILLLNGPNLNLLGKRESEIYGFQTLRSITDNLEKMAFAANIGLDCFQSNHEGALIDKTQELLGDTYAFAIINPGGFSHTSIAWRDAVLASAKPFIEIHLSNIFAREEFRHFSYFSDIAKGVITGLGAQGYELALTAAIQYLLERCDNGY